MIKMVMWTRVQDLLWSECSGPVQDVSHCHWFSAHEVTQPLGVLLVLNKNTPPLLASLTCCPLTLPTILPWWTAAALHSLSCTKNPHCRRNTHHSPVSKYEQANHGLPL